MNAARALRFARRRAGLSQTELARNAGVPKQAVNRVERGVLIPRVDTLQRLLAAAGATLAIERRRGRDIDREDIRALLDEDPRLRLGHTAIETLDELSRRRLRFLVVGDAAARLHGAPVEVPSVELMVACGYQNVAKLERVIATGWFTELVIRVERPDEDAWRDAEELPWLPAPVRVMEGWKPAPSGFLAPMEALLATASDERVELLHAVQEEIDARCPGYRVYRDSERRELRLPYRPPRYWPGRRGDAWRSAQASLTSQAPLSQGSRRSQQS